MVFDWQNILPDWFDDAGEMQCSFDLDRTNALKILKILISPWSLVSFSGEVSFPRKS